LKDAYLSQNWSRLTSELLKIAPAARTCGAEINTVEEIRKKSWLSLENLIFLVSDTPNGKATVKFCAITSNSEKTWGFAP
jgi:hypothetical protein